MAVSWGKTIP